MERSMLKKYGWVVGLVALVVVAVVLLAANGYRQSKTETPATKPQSQSAAVQPEVSAPVVPESAPATVNSVENNQPAAPAVDSGNATPAKQIYEMTGDASHVVVYDVGAGKYQYVINTLNSFDPSAPAPAATCSAEFGVTKIVISGNSATIYINGNYTIQAKVNDLFHALDYGTKDSMKGGHWIGFLKTSCP